MFKKIVFLVLACALVSGVLFAGGRGQAASGPQQIVENANFNRNGYPIVKEKINLRSAVMGRVLDSYPRVLWQRIEEVTNIHVDFFGVDTQQIATFMAAGDWPDFFHSYLARNYINDHGVSGKQLVDYNDLLHYMPNLQQTFKDYPIPKKCMTEVDGSMYQLPYIGRAVTTHWARFYYRTDTLRNNNLQPPTTIDEFYNTLVVLKRNTGNAHLVPVMEELELWFYPSFGSSVQTDFDADSQQRVIFNRTSEQYKRFLQFFSKCYAEGLLHPEFLTLDFATKFQMARQGLFTYCGGSGGNILENLTLEDFPSGEFDIGVPKPFLSQWNNNTKVKAGLGHTRAAGGAISVKSKYIPEIARMVDIGFALTEVTPGSGLYGCAYNYGPEGYCWQFTPDKKEMNFWIPTQHPDVTSHSVMQLERSIMLESFPARAEFGDSITSEYSNNRVRQIGFRDNLMPNTISEFFPAGFGLHDWLHYTPEEQAQMDSKYLDLSRYVQEMRAQFITGVLDIDREWDRYVRTINEMGIADILKIVQVAYDRWIKY